MNWLYLAINLVSISLPLLFSFHPKMNFIKDWKPFLISTFFVGFLFIIWDVWFTSMGVWGFNADYHLEYLIFGLPIEEILFFLCIPFASIFIHFSLAYFYPNLLLPEKVVKILTVLLLLITVVIAISNRDKYYTGINFSVFAVTMLLSWYFGLDLLRRFYMAFVIILIPFFFVNGILTGSWIENEIVWYDNMENLSVRIGSIPVEDFFYAFSMLFLNLMLFNYLNKKKSDNSPIID